MSRNVKVVGACAETALVTFAAEFFVVHPGRPLSPYQAMYRPELPPRFNPGAARTSKR